MGLGHYVFVINLDTNAVLHLYQKALNVLELY